MALLLARRRPVTQTQAFTRLSLAARLPSLAKTWSTRDQAVTIGAVDSEHDRGGRRGERRQEDRLEAPERLRGDAPRGGRGHRRPGLVVEGLRPRRGALLRAHVRRDGGVPPLLL